RTHTSLLHSCAATLTGTGASPRSPRLRLLLHRRRLMFSRLRGAFPTLAATIGQSPLSYLDSGATSQKPQCVIDTFVEYYQQRNSAVHRGAHSLAVEATDAFENGRIAVAGLVGGDAEDRKSVV